MKNKFCALIALLFVSSFTQANILGNMQTLAPTPDSLYFQNVHSSKTLAKNYFNVGFFVAYVKNELSSYDDLTTPDFIKYKDESETFDFVAAWGVTEHFEIFYSLPGFLDQKPESGQVENKYITKGINVHRPGIKYDISQDNSGGFAVVGSIDFPMTENDPYVGNSPTPIYNLELIRDFRRSQDAFGVNLGYRFRKPGATPTGTYFFPLKDQMIASFAYVYGLQKDWRFHAEIYGAIAVDKNPHPEQKHVSALEGLLGYKRKVFKNFWAHVGATAELMPEGLAPDYRIYAGLNYFFGFDEPKSSPAQAAPAESPLVVDPSAIRVQKGGTQFVTVGGGSPKYSYKLADSFGSFDERALVYTAPDQVGSTKLIVRDSKTAVAEIPIEVYGNQAAAIQGPEQVELYEGGRVAIPITGVEAPAQYRLDPSFGFYDEAKQVYLAPTRIGETRLIVTDAAKNEKIVRILVKEIPKASKEFQIRNLKFIFNTDQLIPESEALLEGNVQQFQAADVEKIIVIGHTDNVGKPDYNQKLSLSRAQAVATKITHRLSLKENQVEAVGYGQDRPLSTNETVEGRQINRRVEFKIYFKKSTANP